MVACESAETNTKIFETINRTHFNRLANSHVVTKVEYNNKKLDLIDEGIDLNEQFVPSPQNTFLIRVQGNSMNGAGIDNGDILLVDCSKPPVHGNIVIASVSNKIAVKRLHYSYKETMLLSENDDYLPIRPKESDNMKIWGVAIMVIKDMN